MQFADVAPSEPDLDSLRPQVAALHARLASDAVDDVITDWNALRAPVKSWLAWVNLRYRQDTRDEGIAEEKKRRDAFEAGWEQEELALHQAILNLPAESTESVPPQAMAKWTTAVSATNPAVKDERQRENELIAEYVKLMGGASFDLDGTQHDLVTIGGPATSADRATREKAARAKWTWFDANRAELDRIYDDLVTLRSGIASKLGHRDFVETGYLRMSRVDYGPADVARFREAVRTHIVPLCSALRERQAAAHGIDKVMLWDEAVLEPGGNPEPVPVDQMLAAGTDAFARLDPQVAAFFDGMVNDGWIDLPARPGKSPGGFCTYLSEQRRPFVFCNATGVERDVRTLVHEVGHAFQKEASSAIALPELLHGTLESSEIHSMALEFLAWPVMDAWFGEAADRYRRNHLARAVLFLPYGLLVDEFQHEVYSTPESGPAGRHAMNLALQRSWLPDRDTGDLPHLDVGGFWQVQRHIYAYPFYYIDYCLAQTVALQFWSLAQEDQADAMERYVALCERGGSLPFQALVRTTDLDSPFDDGVVQGVAERVAKALNL
ncbi:MAG: M3 family oligoendopeptidase [Deltaproteobacteria bacterium]|nr:M3 family oligoendopeptidase [Deltaproteobacteria bacterium]